VEHPDAPRLPRAPPMPTVRVSACLVVLFAATASAAEKWADDRLPVTAGLELWLDASRLTARADGSRLESSPGGSGNGRHLCQENIEARPTVMAVGNGRVVRFDGQDDHLRVTGLDRSVDGLTVFLVAAPHSNPGTFCGFCAANAKDQRDYESGFTIDLGPYPTPAFSQLNVEGRGFGGAANLLKSSSPFGTLPP